MKKFFVLIVVLLTSGTLYAAESTRFITKVKLPSGQTAVVSEGDNKARSIGSFKLRVYDTAPPADATTFFSRGLVHARNQVIDKVVLSDVVGDQQPEIIVIIRVIGTEKYLSAHAFVIDKQGLRLSVSVEGLPPDADPIEAIKKSRQSEIAALSRLSLKTVIL